MKGNGAKAAYYVFNNPEQPGWVIVAGDDRARTILAYSDEDYFDAGEVPECVQDWLNDYTEQLARLDTPRLERIWQTYAENPRRLARAIRLWREMKGFNNSEAFYDGVELNEGFERDFRPLEEDERYMPVMLILILDLYFRLTPQTMVAETPEIQELARLMKLKAADVAEVMEVFQYCDPYLNRRGVIFHPLLIPCQEIWRRYGNSDVETLASYAEQLKAYFK
jgi:hypothetical protein